MSWFTDSRFQLRQLRWLRATLWNKTVDKNSDRTFGAGRKRRYWNFSQMISMSPARLQRWSPGQSQTTSEDQSRVYAWACGSCFRSSNPCRRPCCVCWWCGTSWAAYGLSRGRSVASPCRHGQARRTLSKTRRLVVQFHTGRKTMTHVCDGST